MQVTYLDMVLFFLSKNHHDGIFANMLVKGEPNISCICSRYCRAPELIFGATEYTTLLFICGQQAELLLGQVGHIQSPSLALVLTLLLLLTTFIHVAFVSWRKWSWPTGWVIKVIFLWCLYLQCFTAFFSKCFTRRFWVLQQGKKSGAWTQTTWRNQVLKREREREHLDDGQECYNLNLVTFSLNCHLRNNHG